MTSSLPQLRGLEPISEKDFSFLEILGIAGGALIILALIYFCRRQKELRDHAQRQVTKRMEAASMGDGASQVLLTGGFQRKSPEERERLSPNCYTSDPDGHFTYNYKGRGDSYKSTSPLVQPTYYSTVISIEPYSRNGESKSSTSLQLEAYNQQPSEPPSPRVLKNRHNSGGSKASFRDKRGSMKGTKTSAASIRRSTGSFKEPRKFRPHDLDRPRLLSERTQSPRRSCSLRAPQNPFPSPRAGQNRREGLSRAGLCHGSESSVNTVKDHQDLPFPKFGESPSSHSVFSDECSNLNLGLWKREPKRAGNRLHIRYNDAGSMEDLSYSRVEDDEMSLPVGAEAHSYPTNDYLSLAMGREGYNERSGAEGEPQQIKLRATLEEQDWSSGANSDRPIDSPNPRPPKKEDNQRSLIPVRGFPQLSPDGEAFSSHTTSFESNTEAILADESKPPPKDVTHLSSTSAKRQSFKNLLQQRLRREQARNQLEDPGTSFDSVETLESTSTDMSRLEALTTSLESTDSTNDSQHVLFQKTKAREGEAKPLARFFHRALPPRDLEAGRREHPGPRRISIPRMYNREELPMSPLRKTFGRYERQSGSLESVKDPEEPKARSVFTRYFRSPRSSSAYYARDYSIDERSDQLFREFTRFDPNLELPFNVKVHRRANSQKAPKSQECSASGHQRYVSSSENIRNELEKPPRAFSQHSPHSASLLMADC